MFDGDPQARVKDRDRDRAIYVIEAALRNGQITQQDRDLRLERARSAATVGELGGLVRDIADPPAAVPATAVVPPVATPPTGVSTSSPAVGSPYAPGAAPPSAPVPADLYGPPRSTRKPAATSRTLTGASKTGRRFALGCAGIAALFVIVPIAFGIFMFAQGVGSTSPDVVETDPVPAGPPFELTAAGIRSYVDTFANSFEDTEVVRSVFYDGYVVSWVPQGEGKVAIWNYLNGAFDRLGDPMDDTEDSAPVDLADLRPGRVMSLVDTARTTLNVDDPTTTYVIFDRNVIDDDPQVAVYVTNDAGDSGYLLGDLRGNVISTQAN